MFLAALNGISPSFDAAVARMSEVLAITGRVLPVTTADVQLKAFFENGASVVGESKIFIVKNRRTAGLPECVWCRSTPGAAGGFDSHPGCGCIAVGPWEPLYQHHPQSAGGWDCAGNSGVSCTQDLRMQCHDPGGGDGRIYRLRPYPGAFFSMRRQAFFRYALPIPPRSRGRWLPAMPRRARSRCSATSGPVLL